MKADQCKVSISFSLFFFSSFSVCVGRNGKEAQLQYNVLQMCSFVRTFVGLQMTCPSEKCQINCDFHQWHCLCVVGICWYCVMTTSVVFKWSAHFCHATTTHMRCTCTRMHSQQKIIMHSGKIGELQIYGFCCCCFFFNFVISTRSSIEKCCAVVKEDKFIQKRKKNRIIYASNWLSIGILVKTFLSWWMYCYTFIDNRS